MKEKGKSTVCITPGLLYSPIKPKTKRNILPKISIGFRLTFRFPKRIKIKTKQVNSIKSRLIINNGLTNAKTITSIKIILFLKELHVNNNNHDITETWCKKGYPNSAYIPCPKRGIPNLKYSTLLDRIIMIVVVYGNGNDFRLRFDVLT
ncbi:hypothetical protein OkiPb01091_00250 [Escherichia coli]|nr:hypothetical protein [Escherichia coli]